MLFTYNGTALSRGEVRLARPVSLLVMVAQDATVVWVRAEGGGDAAAALTGGSPDAGAGKVTEGWVRVTPDQPYSYGRQDGALPREQQISRLVLYFETDGYISGMAMAAPPTQ